MEYTHILDLSPTEFEKHCRTFLESYAEKENLQNFKITHNKIIKTHDGKYQIDVYAEFTALGVRFKVLCECKRYKNRVNRDKVAILHQKLNSIGAQKGILISTSDFQSGALEYAKEHGIALIKAENYDFTQLSHSSGKTESDKNDPFIYAEKHFPPYCAYECTVDDEPLRIYPSKEYVRELIIKQYQLVKEAYGVDLSINFPEI